MSSNIVPSWLCSLVFVSFVQLGRSGTENCTAMEEVKSVPWSDSLQDLQASVLHEVVQQRSLLAGSGVLAVVSAAVALVTYLGMTVHHLVGAHLYTVVEVRERDPLYRWLLDWLADQREVYEKGSRVFAELQQDCQKLPQEHISVRFFPNDDGSMYWFVFGSALIWLGHHRTEDPTLTKRGVRAELRLRITVLGRSKLAVHALFQAAFEHKKAKLGGRTEVFVAQPGEHAEQSHWRRLEPRRVRPLSTVISSSDPAPQELLADMRQFPHPRTGTRSVVCPTAADTCSTVLLAAARPLS